MKRLNVFLLIFFAGSLSATAEVRLPHIFSDNMVLQADLPAKVWGWAEPGEAVTVEFAGQTKTATADSSKHWKIALDPMPHSSKPRNLQVSTSEFQVSLTNVVVGEVWLCAGQSNMRRPLTHIKHAAEEIAAADYPDIRINNIPEAASDAAQSDIPSTWQVCTPETMAEISAVGYFFARKLHQELGVSVGIINGSYGGTPIQTWLDQDTFSALLKKKMVSDAAAFYEQRYVDALKKWETTQKGKKPQRNLSKYPGYCYNAMIAPIVPYAMRGLIWYQGEANANQPGSYVNWYEAYLNMMRDNLENPNLWAFHVQLAGFEANVDWARFRLAQEECSQFPKTGMVTAVDLGEAKDIHPKNKQDVGLRLALNALNKTYGKTAVVCSGPTVVSAEKRNGHIRLKFSGCEGGLKIKGDAEWLSGFSGVASDGSTVDLDARLVAPDTVDVTMVRNGITLLRYAHANFPTCSIYNQTGLPLLPFEKEIK